MKTILSIFILFFGLNMSFGQTTSHDICSAKAMTFDVWNTTVTRSSFSSVDEAKQTIKDIIAVIGLKPNFEVQAAKIPNAAAVVYRGKRYVLYNPDFINM